MYKAIDRVIDLHAETRDSGRSSSKLLRRANMVPCVLYGNGESKSIAVTSKDIVSRRLHTKCFNVVNITTDDNSDSTLAMVRDCTCHSVMPDKFMHVDFQCVKKDSIVHFLMPIEFTNQFTCPGVKLGGKIKIASYLVRVVGAVDSMPHHIIVDMSKYSLGDAIFARDLELPDGVAIHINSIDLFICKISGSKVASDASIDSA